MTNKKTHTNKAKHWQAALFAAFLAILACGAAWSAAQEETIRQQETLAVDYLFAIARTPDAGEREKLYLKLIGECPDTQDAEEAHWALANLYLDGFSEPKEQEAKQILEKFLERYTSSQWRQHVENRLASLWGN